MARRRFPSATRASRKPHTPTIPKPVVNIKPIVDLNGLVQAYEWFAVEKLLAFKLAFEWYAKAIPGLLFGSPLTPDQQRQYERATKSKNQGDGTDFPEEKITAWTMAIKFYEKVWDSKSLPRLDEYIDRTELSGRVKDVQTVLSSLNTAFKGIVTFRMTLNDEREFLAGEILLPQAEIECMIPMTPLRNALAEAVTVAKVVSIVTDDDGNQSLDGGQFMSKLPALLTDIADWSAGDKATVKAIGKAVRAPRTASAPGTAKAPRAPRQPGTNVKVGKNMTITVVNVNAVPKMSGNRLKALQTIMTTTSTADAKTALASVGLPGYLGWGCKTLVSAGAITLS
jgi:hypothetical protein